MSPFRSCLYVWCYFLQVEVLHDFEAANADELNLKRGDIVLVIPSETTADQVKTCGSFFCGHFFLSQLFSHFVTTVRKHKDFHFVFVLGFI